MSLAMRIVENVVSDQKSRHTEFEVGDDGLRVGIKKGDKVLADFRLGKSADRFTMLRIEGKDEVWAATDILKYQLDRTTTDWRDKTITSFDEKEAEKLQVRQRRREDCADETSPDRRWRAQYRLASRGINREGRTF